MKVSVLEPIGISEELQEEIASCFDSKYIEIVFHPDRKEDVSSLVERTGNADIIISSNIPLTREYIESNALILSISLLHLLALIMSILMHVKRKAYLYLMQLAFLMLL